MADVKVEELDIRRLRLDPIPIQVSSPEVDVSQLKSVMLALPEFCSLLVCLDEVLVGRTWWMVMLIAAVGEAKCECEAEAECVFRSINQSTMHQYRSINQRQSIDINQATK